MAAKRYTGTKLAKIGTNLVITSLALYIFVTVSVYAVTSYYDRDWQFTLIAIASWLLGAGVILVPLGIVINTAQGKYDKKR